jgi:type-F conjugative transfer system protein TraW
MRQTSLGIAWVGAHGRELGLWIAVAGASQLAGLQLGDLPAPRLRGLARWALLTGVLLTVLSAAIRDAHAAAAPAKPEKHQDLGQVGPLYPITEKDLLREMQSRARQMERDGAAARLKARMRRQAEAYAKHPPAVGVPTAARSIARLFDPSITVPYAIRDAKGRVLYPAGTHVNPLAHFSFDETLTFINAEDPTQVAWLRKRLAGATPTVAQQTRVVLTGGSPAKLGRELRRPVYFDQRGLLIQHFGIGAVPATIAADPQAPRRLLLIREYAMQEGAR